MHYYNGLSAAKRIGISYKTLLRYIEKGRIIPEEGKTPSGQLVISEDQVEMLRMEIQHERDMFRQPQSATPRDRHNDTDTDSQGLPLTDTTLAETVKQLGKLQAQIDIERAHREQLEQRVSELERLSQSCIDSPSMSVDVEAYPPEAQNTPSRHQVDVEEAKPQQQAQNRNVARFSVPDDLPEGTLHSTDFAEKLGIKLTVFEGILKNGIRGEQLDRIRVLTAREGRYTNYFSPSQQQKAIEILKKHGKLV